MTNQEAIEILEERKIEPVYKAKRHIEYVEKLNTALDIATEALKAQDRPIICPRCGRTFAESEGREE